MTIMGDALIHECVKTDSSEILDSGELIVVNPPQPKPTRGASRFLVKDREYRGNYIAYSSFNDRKPITWGRDFADVRREATEKGFPKAIIFYAD
jgi:hypothetical protein